MRPASERDNDAQYGCHSWMMLLEAGGRSLMMIFPLFDTNISASKRRLGVVSSATFCSGGAASYVKSSHLVLLPT